MPMERPEVGQGIVAPVLVHMVDLYEVSIFEEQFTPPALALLLLEQLRERAAEHRVCFQPP
jgi:hypothetical protein